MKNNQNTLNTEICIISLVGDRWIQKCKVPLLWGPPINSDYSTLGFLINLEVLSRSRNNLISIRAKSLFLFCVTCRQGIKTIRIICQIFEKGCHSQVIESFPCYIQAFVNNNKRREKGLDNNLIPWIDIEKWITKTERKIVNKKLEFCPVFFQWTSKDKFQTKVRSSH